jgi:Uma2 family endonuclease
VHEEAFRRSRPMGSTKRRLTADDLWDIQGSDPNVHGWELVNGELVEVSPANLPHGRIQSRLAHLLWNHVDRHGGGVIYTEGGFVLQVPGDSERVRGPDVAFVSNATLEAAGGEPEKGYARMHPELAAEVFSPANLKDAREFQQKIVDYADAGVSLVWVLYPDSRSALVHHPDGSSRLVRGSDAYLDGEDVLPGFRVALTDLFG